MAPPNPVEEKTMALRALALVLVVTLLPAGAFAQARWPAKQIRYVVPFPPAGATDILARIVADKISQSLGVSVIVENHPGAAGNVGTEMVVKSAPDGYTVMQATVANAISETLYSDLRFSFARDIAPVAMIATVPNVMVVNPSVPARTVQEFIELARSKPGQLNYASSGSGTSIHMSAELFKLMAGVDMLHVPYKGSGPALADLLGGRVAVMFDNLPASMAHIKSGKLRALAVTTPARTPSLDVPTISESVPGYEAMGWFGMVAPRALPREIVARLNAEVNAAVALPDVRSKLIDQGADPSTRTPEQFGAFIQSEIGKWSKVVKASGAKPD
jgi:tripartite-type tricarboxylate transporter receptor subunit TctC